MGCSYTFNSKRTIMREKFDGRLTDQVPVWVHRVVLNMFVTIMFLLDWKWVKVVASKLIFDAQNASW